MFYSNQLDRDRVWTFGSGPRMCIGHKFIHKIIKVCAQDEERVNRTLSLLTTIPKNVTLPPLRDILKECCEWDSGPYNTVQQGWSFKVLFHVIELLGIIIAF